MSGLELRALREELSISAECLCREMGAPGGATHLLEVERSERTLTADYEERYLLALRAIQERRNQRAASGLHQARVER